MAYGISYGSIKYDTPYFGPTPSYYVGQITSNLSGYSPKVLSYQSPFYGTSYGTPRFYFGPTPVYYADVSSAITATLTAAASHIINTDASLSGSATLTSVAQLAMQVASSSSFSATLSAAASVTRYASASTSVTATLTSASSRTTLGQTTTSITASLTAFPTKTMQVGSQLSIISNIIDSAIDDHIAIANLFVNGTLTTAGQRIANALASLGVTANLDAVISSQFFVGASQEFITTFLAAVSQVYPANSQLGITATLSARVKRANPTTDHDTVFYGQIMPRPWAGELLQRQWAGEIQTVRDESANLGTKQADGILGERNKFATLAQRRWEGMLL